MVQVKSNLGMLCKLAKELGATNAVAFDANNVVVDERVLLKCRVPICDDYGINLMCPPNVMGIREFREVLARYSWAILIQMEAPVPAVIREEIQHAEDVAALYRSERFLVGYKQSIVPIRIKLHRIAHKVEAKAFALGYCFATAFIAGPCRLCSECVTPQSNEPCRHPFRARPSMEAMGIDVFTTAKKAGLPFDIPLKEKMVWNGLILIT